MCEGALISMYSITIVRRADSWLVIDGVQKKARLYWHAPGLDIYVVGAIPLRVYDRVCNIAVNECIDRRIPAIALRRVGK